MKQTITYIPTEKIKGHPQNPRKQLGDLTELTASIRENGIFQNLTVIPNDDGTYTAIIGHRRLAAAKAAGLSEVPCIITQMDEKTQISTMLLENMQRNDLTVYEQAQTFKQLKFDFGVPVAEISKKTGLSKSTVSKRLKIAELDFEKLKALEGKQFSMADFDELNKIEDIDKRNELVEAMGTSDFKWKVNSAIKEQNEAKIMQKLMPVLETFATELNGPKWDYERIINYYPLTELTEIKVPADAGKVEYYWKKSYSGLNIYKKPEKKKKTESDKAAEEADKRRKERVRKLDELAVECYAKRRKFMLSTNFDNIDPDNIFRFITVVFPETPYPRRNTGFIRQVIFGVEDSIGDFDYDELVEINTRNKRSMAVYMLYALTDDNGRKTAHDGYTGKLKNKEHNYNAEELRALYEGLIILGYEMSDEETAYLDGSHAYYEG